MNKATNIGFSIHHIVIYGIIAFTMLLLATRYYYLAILPSAGALFFLMLYRYPQFGIYALIFLIPFGAFRKIPVGSGQVNVAWILAGATLLVFLIAKITERGSFSDLKNKLTPWLALFFITAIISCMYSPYPKPAFKDLQLWIAAFLYIGLIILVIPKQGFWHTIPTLLVTSIGLSALLGNLSYVFNLSLFTEEHMGGNLTRNVGGTIDPNNLSLMLICTLPLIAYQLIYAKSKGYRVLYMAILVNHMLAIGLTFSRGGFVVLLLTLSLLAYEFRHLFKVKLLGFILLGGAIGLTAFVAVMPASFWERQASLTSWDDSSLIRRSSYLIVAADAFIERPIIGHGLDSFYSIYAQTPFAKLDKLTGIIRGRYAHNSYLEILIGTGIIGFVFFLIILYKALHSFTEARRRYIEANMLQQAFFMASMRLFLISILIYLLLFSETHHKFMLVGLAMSQLALKYSEQELKDVTT